ncbi:expressed unknown protein [Seminavis robusta]|uniref:Uncharacterized protein n=1 Tax=Seminavis robusta TaxID=568900 RepID=A0A9N8EBR1_9STRA|nr:expressed unknown protein [Seminavis robusta]|eukprot:Sro776_g200920.1 n/a (635) ;mRNA; f:25674-27578
MVRPSFFSGGGNAPVSTSSSSKGHARDFPGKLCCRKISAVINSPTLSRKNRWLLLVVSVLALMGVAVMISSNSNNNKTTKSSTSTIRDNSQVKMKQKSSTTSTSTETAKGKTSTSTTTGQEKSGTSISANQKQKQPQPTDTPKKSASSTSTSSSSDGNAGTPKASTSSSTKATSTKSTSTSTSTSTTTSSASSGNNNIIAIDMESTHAKDIASILHDPNTSQISVTLTSTAACKRPYFMARLSGPALIRLPQFSLQQFTNTWTSTYQVPNAATYFLEILLVHCTNPYYQLHQHENPIHKEQLHQDWLSTKPDLEDYLKRDKTAKLCVTTPLQYNRITQKGVSIAISKFSTAPIAIPSSIHPPAPWMGFWYSQNDQYNNAVYTRQQASDTGQCPDDDCSVERFTPYIFQWNTDKPLSLDTLKQDHADIICILGDSHARALESTARSLGFTIEDTNVMVRNAWITFPEEVTKTYVSDLVDNFKCTHIVVAVGLGPAHSLPPTSTKTTTTKFNDNRPYPLHVYYRQVKELLQTLVHHPKVRDDDIGVYIKTVDSQPLRASTTACPLLNTDWGTPTVLDAYNTILRRLSNELDVPLVDTETVIASHVWDAADDWYHVNAATNEAMTLFLIAMVLRPHV